MSNWEKTTALGTIVSLLVLGVSLLLPVLMGPNISWEEASLGYIPAGVCFLVFNSLFVLARVAVKGQEAATPATYGSWRGAVGNLVAFAALIAGGVGGAFCISRAWECQQIGEMETQRMANFQQEIAALKLDASKSASTDETKLVSLEQELSWLSPEAYYQDYRFFRGWALFSLGAAVLGTVWLGKAWLTRRKS